MKHDNIKLRPDNLDGLEKTYLYQYHQAIKSGEIKASYYLTTELENLLDDLSNEDFYFDTTEAYRRIDFIENCLRMTKSPFYGAPFKLELFQKAFIETLYSFYMVNDNTQRFQRALFLLARKNGKSMLCSALALTDLVIGGKGLDIVCSSNDDNQASILTDEVDTMRTMIDPNNKATWRNQKGIKCLLNNNKIFKLSQRTRNKEGRNIDTGIVDEVHEMTENVIVKSIEQSQSLKPNPKLILITTEGFVQNGFLDEELARAKAIVRKEIDDSAAVRYLPWIYEQDSENEVWQGDRENRLWQKANPLLGTAKRYSYLEQQVDKAKTSKTERAFVLAKDFNIKQSNAMAWLKAEDYNYEAVFDLEDFKGSICLGAADIAETTDLTSARILMMKPNDDKKYVYQMYFIPEGKLKNGNDDKSAGAEYKEWAKKGMLRICDGNYLNTSVVADWFYELYKKYGIKTYKIGYDSKFANEFINRLEEYGFDSEVIWQRPQILTRGINMAEIDLQSKQIIGLNEIDKWCIGNSTLKTDSNGFSILEKIKGNKMKKIDGAVTLVMLMEMFARHRSVLEK